MVVEANPDQGKRELVLTTEDAHTKPRSLYLAEKH